MYRVLRILLLLILCARFSYAYTQKKGLPIPAKTGKELVHLWDSLEEKDLNHFADYTAEDWLSLLESSYKEAKKTNDTALSYGLSWPLAYVYHSTTNFNKSIPLLNYLKAERKRIGEGRYKMVLLKLEESYLRTGNIKQAIDIRRVRISESFTDHFWEIYEEAGLYEEAIKDLKSNGKEQPGYDWYNTFRHFQLGHLFFKNKELDSAYTHYLIAKRYCDKVIASSSYKGQSEYTEYIKRYMAAKIMGGVAQIYILRKEYRKAIPLLKEDIEQSRNIREISNALLKRLDVAECYLALGDQKTCKLYLDTVRVLMNETKFYSYDFRYLKLQADYFLNIKRFDSASYYMNAYMSVKDTLDERMRKNKAIALLAILDTDKQRATVEKQKLELETVTAKEAERKAQLNLLYAGVLILIIVVISILINNREKTRRKKQIERSLAEKEILLKEIHHRVKNNLTTLKSLFYLQARSSDKKEVQLALEECQLRIQSMALVHQSLYDENANEKVDLKHFLQQLFNQLELSLTPTGVDIEIDYKGTEIGLDMEVSLFLGMVINELATNSFKYAFEGMRSGKIGVEIQKENGTLQVIYFDNGPGLKKEFDLNNSGFGFKLIRILTQQMKAIIKYTKTTERSSFIIELPLK